MWQRRKLSSVWSRAKRAKSAREQDNIITEQDSFLCVLPTERVPKLPNRPAPARLAAPTSPSLRLAEARAQIESKCENLVGPGQRVERLISLN